MPVSQTSINTYHEERAKLSQRAQDIYDFMRGLGPLTDREIMQRMGFREPNSVRPRITELVNLGLLEECDLVRCHYTGKTVRRVRRAKPKFDGEQLTMGF